MYEEIQEIAEDIQNLAFAKCIQFNMKLKDDNRVSFHIGSDFEGRFGNIQQNDGVDSKHFYADFRVTPKKGYKMNSEEFDIAVAGFLAGLAVHDRVMDFKFEISKPLAISDPEFTFSGTLHIKVLESDIMSL